MVMDLIRLCKVMLMRQNSRQSFEVYTVAFVATKFRFVMFSGPFAMIFYGVQIFQETGDQIF